MFRHQNALRLSRSLFTKKSHHATSNATVSQNQRRHLNIHEYQAKELMGKYNVPHQRGKIVRTVDEVEKVCEQVKSEFGTENMILKAQILAGGRGKGVFDTGYKGGVKFCTSTEKVKDAAKEMLGNRLITKQTSATGTPVQTLMVTECLDFDRELYFAILLDRASDGPVIVASSQGGMDIEEVAKTSPEAIVKVPINYTSGVTQADVDTVAKEFGYEGQKKENLAQVMKNLYQMFVDIDCTQLEINPLVETTDGRVLCVDGKVNIDDNASFRQKEIFTKADTSEMDPRELEAEKYNLNYVALDGNIGCMVNGAGLAMATMDIVKLYGGEPANFLDVGGSASVEQVKGAFQIITNDSAVKCILVNIFGGIMRCDVIAEGIVEAAKQLELKVPLVVRLAGTNVDKGLDILRNSKINVIGASDLDDASQKAVKAISL